jgi:endonuclease-3
LRRQSTAGGGATRRARRAKPDPARPRHAAPAAKNEAAGLSDLAAATAAERLAAILPLLEQTYPTATTALRWQDPVQLLVATILSAQCTDVRVNQVTPALFARLPDAAALAAAPATELEALVRTTGFFRNKAKAIKGACQQLVERHDGKVPRSMEAMLELPGVARKTANVVLGTAFGLATGVVVDTHVKRLAARLGLTAEQDPDKIERDLMALVPQARWISFSHQLILHGRALCHARKPECRSCPLAPHCPSAGTLG